MGQEDMRHWLSLVTVLWMIRALQKFKQPGVLESLLAVQHGIESGKNGIYVTNGWRSSDTRTGI